MAVFLFLVPMHDYIFEHEVNIFSTREIYLMGGFWSSYFFIPLGFFLSKLQGIIFLYFQLIS